MHNGKVLSTVVIPPTDGTVSNMTVRIPAVNQGDFIDLVMDPRGTDGAESDSFDSINYFGTIDVEAGLAPSWNSMSTKVQRDEDASRFWILDLSTKTNLLQIGGNVLAIQGLNASVDDDDFLQLPVLEQDQIQFSSVPELLKPTPAAVNVVTDRVSFKIIEGEHLSDSTFQLTFESLPGRDYRIEYRDDLFNGAWTEVTVVRADADSTLYMDEGVLGLTSRFYRVTLLAPGQ
jgi:hypothetical protein